MTEAELLKQIRSFLGEVHEQKISDRALAHFTLASLHWFNTEVGGHTTENDTAAITLVAGTSVYALPTDCLEILRVEWNTDQLKPDKLEDWHRDGLDWVNDTASTPTAFAVKGRNIYVYPKPSAGAVSTDSSLTLLFKSCSIEASGGVLPGLTTPDGLIVAAYAARAYCIANPLETDRERVPGLTQLIEEWLPMAKARGKTLIPDYSFNDGSASQQMTVTTQIRGFLGAEHGQVTDREISHFITSALHWFNSETGGHVPTTSTSAVTIVAGTYSYTLPTDCLKVVRAEWNETKLEASSIATWQRDGINFSNNDGANPTEFAVLGRTLYLYPTPTATSVSTDSTVTLIYRSSTVGPTSGALTGLTQPDLMIVAAYAARSYTLTHPTRESKERASGLTQLIAEWLPDAKRRARNMIEDYYPRLKSISYRTGGYR